VPDAADQLSLSASDAVAARSDAAVDPRPDAAAVAVASDVVPDGATAADAGTVAAEEEDITIGAPGERVDGGSRRSQDLATTLSRAERAARNENWEEARRLAKRVLDVEPDNVRALIVVGMDGCKTGNAALANAVAARVPPKTAELLRSMCKQRGVALPTNDIAGPSTPEPEPVPPNENIIIRIKTEPPGASVLVNGKILGLTPYEGVFKREDRMFTFVLDLPGHRIQTFEARADRAITRNVTLQRL
jgi:hypothetical protein